MLLHGDIEINPGPRSKRENISFCHWNLNSLTAHNFSKVSLLQAYNSSYNYDIICLSETYLDSSVTSDNDELSLNGYKLIRADHPNNVKRGGVAIYYSESLAVRILDTSYLNECILLEIELRNSKYHVCTIYRSPSQCDNEFETFLNGFEILLDNVYNVVSNGVTILGDFNARCKNWWDNDINTLQGIRIDALATTYGFYQLIKEPTHFTTNSASCIDLIFTNQPNITTDSGVHSSLHTNCHHQLIYAKLNVDIHYPPPYERVVWDYNKADTALIRKSLQTVNWEFQFRNKSLDNQVKVFNEIILNVFKNFIPYKIKTFNDKEPVWMNDSIKRKIKNKNCFYKKFVKNGRTQSDYEVLEQLIIDISKTVSSAKESYFNRLTSKLCSQNLHPKAYWQILKTFFNGKKIPIIPPLMSNGHLISDFKAKANLFNEFFSKQCTPLSNNSSLPSFPSNLSSSKLATVNINKDDILNIIRRLNTNKAHGHDDISIKMLKLCDNSIVEPLYLIFSNCLHYGQFPDIWKKSNVVPIHKKGDKQLVNNYRPVSLLPICGKILERIIFNSIYKYLDDNNLLSSNQSGFRMFDSCTNQLLSITHNIYSAFDCNPSLETRSIFLDISKAFDKVWHEGLIYKCRVMGIDGNLLSLITSFLSNRFQRTTLNGQCSDWRPVLAGVPQGSILGPLFFIIYINDLTDGLLSKAKLFADDTSLFSIVFDSKQSAIELNSDLNKISKWAYQWKMSFNPDPTKQAQEVIFSRKISKNVHPAVNFNGTLVTQVPCQKHLGMYLDKS